MKQYFRNDELCCKCCGKLIIDQDFLERLNKARELADFPFIVTSGYRCPTHNVKVGSQSTNHTTGKAADIECIDPHRRYMMVRAMIEAGILGIGIGLRFIHCDINRASWTLWTY